MPNKKYCEYGDLLITCTGENDWRIAESCTYLGSEKIIAGSDLFVLKHTQNPKYIAYALSTTNSKVQKRKLSSGSNVLTHISYASVKKIQIPLPPLETQKQMADLLDSFRTSVKELTINLKKELYLRKKQYEYYRDKLISDVIEKGWGEYRSLEEIATEIYRGSGVTNSQIGSGDYPCTTPGSISNAFSVWFDCCNFKINPSLIKNPKYFEYGTLLLVAASQVMRCIADCCAYLGKEKAIAGGNMFLLTHNQNP
ncbi:putative type-1 restriction enzyme specificity protein MPN_089, partial [Candidatus Mycoplasma haematohominis]